MNQTHWETFCGASTFWSTQALKHSSYPKFTECFQETTFTFIPCGWLWLTAGFHLAYLHRHTRFISLSTTWLHTARLSVAVALALMSGLHLFLPLQEHKELPPSFYLSQAVWLTTYLFAAVLIVWSRRCGVMSPCVVFIFWSLTMLFTSVPFYTSVAEKYYETKVMRFSVDLVTFALAVAEFGLQVAPDSQVQLLNPSMFKQPCPEMTASFVSKLTYSWMSRLMYQTKKRTLAVSDIFDAPGFMGCQHNVPTFIHAWQNERLKETKLRNRHQNGHYFKLLDSKKATDRTKLLPNKSKQKILKTTSLLANGKQDNQRNTTKSKVQPKRTASLYLPLFKMYAVSMLKVFVVGLLREVIRFSSPALLGLTIMYLDKRDELPKWHGYTLAVALFAGNLIAGFLDSYCFFRSNNIGTTVKTVLSAAVYKKTLTMNAGACRNFTLGTIVNLVSVDCHTICDIITRLYVLLLWPFTMLFTFFMMYYVLGLAAIVGIAGFFLLIPTNACTMALLRKTQTKQLKFKDHRVKLLSEILNGIKVIKLNAWEVPFQKKVLDARQHEVRELKKAAIMNAINTLCWVASPVLITLSTLAVYVLFTGDPLTPTKAFVTVDLINTMRANTQYLPNIITTFTQSQVAMKRLKKFLLDADLTQKENFETNPDFPIQMENATFTWDRSATPILHNISVTIPKDKLIAVVGPVGAGKSSLLSAMLKEMELVSGQNSLTGRVAYVPQQAWILNMTLRDNIRLQKPLKEEFYGEVVAACALEADIDLLPGGDLTEIGEKGTNLSGGQKQRVSLARAVYQDADIYLLDDPLSAVDAHVGKHIFHNVIGPQGVIKNKTRVMVTHGVHWLPMVDAIVVMDQGKITEAGTYKELMNHDGPFAKFLRTYLLDQKDDAQNGLVDKNGFVSGKTKHKKNQNKVIQSNLTNGSILKHGVRFVETNPELKSDTRLIEEESVKDGEIRPGVFVALLKAFGYVPATAALFLLLLYNGANLAAGLWLSEWTNDGFLANHTNKGTHKYSSDTGLYIGVYAALTCLQVVGNVLFVMLVFIHMVAASQRLHNKMLNTILHQSMSFFDTTPIGRILNRFSRDIDVLDCYVPRLCWIVLHNFLNVFITIIIIGYSTPVALAVLPPLLYLYFKIQRFYVHIFRHFRRLELTTRSPILSLLTDTVHGASSIRAYGIGDRYFTEFQDLLDTNNKCNFVADTGARWIKPRLKLLTSTLVLLVSLFVVTSNDVSASMGGLSITMALQVTFSLNMLVQYIAMQETNIVSCERVIDYVSLPFEPEWVKVETKPSPTWPDQGMISFRNYNTRYRPHLDVVLRDVSFTIQPGQKVGVVGRTGAGKSSLTVALFRLIEATRGSICIDGLDISAIGLHDLRAGLTILPQEPVLFSGTVRYNLDPFQCHSDTVIWEALGHAHVSSCVKQLPGQLDHHFEDGGHSLSVGQRQLMCLARSLLRKTRILVLDEATAAVDLETDAVLQDTIREAFRDCTVLTVAHRLNTVIDYDEILVLENGEIAEFGSPEELLKKKSGIFSNMARKAGLS